MTELKPYSEAFFNVLELLDKTPIRTEEGVSLDNLRLEIESYFIDYAIGDGYIIEKPRGSVKYKITTYGVALLTQMRLVKAMERTEKSNNRNFLIELVLSIVIGLATIFIGIVPLFRN